MPGGSRQTGGNIWSPPTFSLPNQMITDPNRTGGLPPDFQRPAEEPDGGNDKDRDKKSDGWCTIL
jgi:hypothetical protein